MLVGLAGYIYCLLDLNMLCDCVTRGCGDHSPLTTAAILEWRRRSSWGGAAAARRGQRGESQFGLVVPEDVRPSEAETMILPRTPYKSLVARGLDFGRVLFGSRVAIDSGSMSRGGRRERERRLLLSWAKAENDSKGRNKATRSEGDDLGDSAARALMRHGGRGRGVRG